MGSPHKFTTEFNCSAAAYYLEHKGKMTKQRAANNLSVSISALDRWAKNPRYNQGGAAPKLTLPAEGDLEAENKRLLKENAGLREEREILKKAAAFFANEESGQRK